MLPIDLKFSKAGHDQIYNSVFTTLLRSQSMASFLFRPLPKKKSTCITPKTRCFLRCSPFHSLLVPGAYMLERVGHDRHKNLRHTQFTLNSGSAPLNKRTHSHQIEMATIKTSNCTSNCSVMLFRERETRHAKSLDRPIFSCQSTFHVENMVTL